MLHACILVFQYALKHHLSAKAFSELLLLLKVLLPAAANLPSSMYLFKHLFVELFPSVNVIECEYCKCCHMLAGSETTNPACRCDEYDRFVAVPIAPQLKELIKGMWHSAYITCVCVCLCVCVPMYNVYTFIHVCCHYILGS